MSGKRPCGTVMVTTAALLSAPAAAAQTFQDTQVIMNRVLFEAEDAAAERRAAEARRIAALDRRAEQQDRLLQEQAASVRQLGSELQALRTERQVTDLAAAFDASIGTRQWAAARALLTDTATIDVGGVPGAGATSVVAAELITDLSRSSTRIAIGPRINRHVRIDADRATLTAEGTSWAPATDERPGRYEYRFARTGADWKIESITFRPAD